MKMPEPGTYNNVMAGDRALSTNKKGNLEFAMICLLEDESAITAYIYLTKDEGKAINTGQVDSLKNALNWDGVDMDALITEPFEMFQIVVDDEEYNGEWKRKVKWINPNNSEGGHKLECGDMNKIRAKFGAMLRAASGGTPVSRPPASRPPKPAPQAETEAVEPEEAPAAPAKPASKPPATRKPGAKAKPAASRSSSAEECWDTLNKTMTGQPEDDILAKWEEVVGATGKSSEDMTPEDWGKVLPDCIHGENLPF